MERHLNNNWYNLDFHCDGHDCSGEFVAHGLFNFEKTKLEVERRVNEEFGATFSFFLLEREYDSQWVYSIVGAIVGQGNVTVGELKVTKCECL